MAAILTINATYRFIFSIDYILDKLVIVLDKQHFMLDEQHSLNICQLLAVSADGWSQGVVLGGPVFHDAFGLLQFSPALFDGSLVDALQVLFECDFLFEPFGSLLLTFENDVYFLFQPAYDFFFFGFRVVFFCLYFGSDEEKFKRVFYCDFEVVGLAVHEELREVEQVFALGRAVVNGALLVHVDKLLLTDPLVQVLIKLPNHALHFCLPHPHPHLVQHLLHLLGREEFVSMWGRECFEHASQVLFLCGIDFELLQFLLNGLLLLGLALPQLLEVELEPALCTTSLSLEQDRVFVLLLQVWRQVSPPHFFLLFLHLLLYRLSPQNTEECTMSCNAVGSACYKDALWWLSFINKMSEVRIARSADEIENSLNQTLSLMLEHQKNGNYVEAEAQRLHSEQLKKDLEARRIFEMEQRHAQETADLRRAHEEELRNFNTFWDKKISDYIQEGEKLVRDMEGRHQANLDNHRADLDKQLPIKVKESSELLNLRKMEEHMARQKLYNEAQKVKERLAELETQERNNWLNARSLKIETALNTLRARQAAELAALQKKIKTGLDQQNKDRIVEEGRLNQKYTNIQKELRGNHDKEVMAFRGQFRSKGGQGSPLLLSKSKLNK